MCFPTRIPIELVLADFVFVQMWPRINKTLQKNTDNKLRLKKNKYCQFSGVVFKPFDNEVFFSGVVLHENIKSCCKYQLFYHCITDPCHWLILMN